MRRVVFLSFVVVSWALVWCTRDKTPLGPVERAGLCPQQEIPWPSIANSPWPMMWADPQCTARGKYPGARLGKVVWGFAPVRMDGECVNVAVAGDCTIYWAARVTGALQLTLFVIGMDGRERARVPLGPKYQDSSSPILLAHGSVLVIGCRDGAFYEYTRDGQVGTPFCLGRSYELTGPGVGLDGTIYLHPREDHLFLAVNPQGQVVWTNTEKAGIRKATGTWLSMSPDGQRLYALVEEVSGPPQLTAFDAQTGVIVWEVPVGWHAASPAVDAYGNVYCVKQGDAGKPVLASFGPDGSLRWESSRPVCPYTNVAIAGDGRVYAPAERGGDLLCFDCEGHLLWSVRPLFGLCSEGALVVDSEGVVYFAADRSVEAFDRDGRRLFVSEMPGNAWALHAMAIPCPGRLIVVGDAQIWCIE
ncbi:MAG: PQQ-like beta-propeller repeat protein [Calditrichaeota bacterium]|nr:PQQ-like beta-propeller repeat protein [Calditrichota bacterium]